MSINKLQRGYAWVLFAKGTGSWVHIAYLSDFAISESWEVEEVSSKDNGNVKVTIPTIMTWEVSTNAYVFVSKIGVKGTTTSASTTVTATDTSKIAVGDKVTGTGIPAGATVATIISPTSFTLSAAATAAGTDVDLVIDSNRLGDVVAARNFFTAGNEIEIIAAKLKDSSLPTSTTMNTDETTGDVDLTVSYYRGKALITNFSHTYGGKDIATYSMTLTGTTALAASTAAIV